MTLTKKEIAANKKIIAAANANSEFKDNLELTMFGDPSEIVNGVAADFGVKGSVETPNVKLQYDNVGTPFNYKPTPMTWEDFSTLGLEVVPGVTGLVNKEGLELLNEIRVEQKKRIDNGEEVDPSQVEELVLKKRNASRGSA